MFPRENSTQYRRGHKFSSNFCQTIIFAIFTCIISSSFSEGNPENMKNEACSAMMELSKRDGFEKAVNVVRECMVNNNSKFFFQHINQ